MREADHADAALEVGKDEMLVQGGLKSLGLAEIGAILFVKRVEEGVAVFQRLRIDPIENADATDGEQSCERIEGFDRLVVDEQQRKQGNLYRYEELPQKVDLRPCLHDGVHQQLFSNRHAISPSRKLGRTCRVRGIVHTADDAAMHPVRTLSG